jgi:uncharacterized protein YndB with AHSA1/START domain
MRREATRTLLASRGDAWAVLSEPYHLPDWWPSIRGVQPDRRGFGPGARWQVLAREPLPLIGQTEPKRPVQLVVGEVEPFERWTWHLTTRIPLDVDIRLADAGHAQTLVTVAVSASRLAAPGKLARTAVDRLYDLCQTGAEDPPR